MAILFALLLCTTTHVDSCVSIKTFAGRADCLSTAQQIAAMRDDLDVIACVEIGDQS